MSNKNDGGAAFPYVYAEGSTSKGFTNHVRPGMSLQDYFAAKAMQAVAPAIIAQCEKEYFDPEWVDGIAHDAYRIADAMIARREKERGQ